MYSKSPPSKKNASQDLTARRTYSFNASLKKSPIKNSPGLNLPQKRYEKYCCGHITQALYTEFLADLQNIAKRINCHFHLSLDTKTVFSSIISALLQNVDQILYLQKSFYPDSADLSINSDKKSDSFIIKTKSISELSVTPKNCVYDEQIKIQDNEKKGLNLNLSYSNIRPNKLKEKIPWKTESSDQESPKKNQTKAIQSLLHDIDYPESGVKSKDESCSDCQHYTELGKNLLEPCFICQENRKTGSGLLEISRCEYIGITPTNKTQDLLCLKEYELNMRERLLKKGKLDLEAMVASIKQTIEAYNDEVKIREEYLDREKLQITLREQQINQKLKELNEIEEKLFSSKCELEEISGIFPKFESYFEFIGRILTQIYSLKHNFENFFTQKLEVNRKLVKKNEPLEEVMDYKIIGVVEEEEINLHQEIFDYKGSEELCFNEICRMRKELEEKLKILEDKEAEIIKAKKEIDEANEENLKTLMILKSVKLELTNRKLKSENIINRKIEKLKKLKSNLVSAVYIG